MRRRDPIGPLMDLNRGKLPFVRLLELANKLRAAKLPYSVLDEHSKVDDAGVVTRTVALCQHCTGACCQHLRVPITREDARRLAKHLGVSVRKLPLLPNDGHVDEPEDSIGYLAKEGRPCPLFSRGCSVHDVRPNVCRQFGLQECVEARTFTPLVTVRRRAAR